MKIKEITVSIGGTVNLGNYENLRVDVSATVAVDGIVSLNAATRALTAQVRQALAEQLEQVSRNARGSHVFAALEDIGGRADAEKDSDSDDIAF